MKRLAAFLTALTLAMAVFAGGTAEAVPANKGETSIMVFERGWVAPDVGTSTDNPWTKWIVEKSGVNVKWIAVPRNEIQSSLNTMFAAGTAPDLIHDFVRGTVAYYRAQGVLRPVDDIIEKYSVNYKKYLEQNKALKPYVTFDDGKMWAFSSVRPIDSIANHTMWIRKDWLDNLGLKAPDTEEEFFAVADAFAKKDPDRNGKNDTFAFSAMLAYFPIISQMYFNSGWYVENGKLELDLFTERYAAMLAFHKKAYDSGWLDPEYITDRDRSRQNQLWVTGKAGIAFGGLTPPDLPQLLKNDPKAEIIVLRPFKTKFGRNGLLEEPLAFRFVGMNEKTKFPEQSMKLLDWMIDTGWYDLFYGTLGKDHELVNGKIPRRIIDEDKWKKFNNYAIDLMLVDNRYMEPSWIPIMAASDPVSQQVAKLRQQALEVQMMDKYRKDLPYDPTADELTQFGAEFGPIQSEITDKTIIGGPSATVDAAVVRLRSEWKRLGGDKVMQIYNDWFAKNKSALGF